MGTKPAIISVPALGDTNAAESGELSGKPVGAVVNAMKILRFLGDSAVPAGVNHIAREVKISPSSCFNILRTLAREDYVSFDPDRKEYAIGPGVMDIAARASRRAGDINSVRPLVERIAREHEVTVMLWRRISDDRILLVMAALGTGNTRIQMSVGQRLPLIIGAVGRVMAAFSNLNRRDLKKRFAELKWDRPLSFEDFMLQVEETRARGWAFDEGYYAMSTASIAVPVFDSAGMPVMSCSATMFIHQYDPQRGERIAAELGKVSRALTQALPHL